MPDHLNTVENVEEAVDQFIAQAKNLDKLLEDRSKQLKENDNPIFEYHEKVHITKPINESTVNKDPSHSGGIIRHAREFHCFIALLFLFHF